MSDDVDCPYCNEQQEINHDDGYGFDEGETHKQTCSECDKTFLYTTVISYSYDADKAPCLNGDSDHDWRYYAYRIREYDYKVCKFCDSRESLSDEEFEVYKDGENKDGHI